MSRTDGAKILSTSIKMNNYGNILKGISIGRAQLDLLVRFVVVLCKIDLINSFNNNISPFETKTCFL